MALSEFHKKRISESLKKAHKEGRHLGWKHINTNPNYMSNPEIIFNKALNKDDFFKDYHIEYGFSVGKYFLDFAFLNILLDVEIDGQQHLRDENIIHDNLRDEFLNSECWHTYRISVKELHESTKCVIENLKKFILSESKHRSYDIDLIKQKYVRNPKYGSREKYFNARRNANDGKVKPIIKELLDSNIDFSKFGWVNKASKIIGIKPQKVNTWMKRFMPDFYSNCYKRNSYSSTE